MRTYGRKLHLAGRIVEGSTVIADARAMFIEVGVERFECGGNELPKS
ncbi:MAG: hypothetical protein WAP35_10790 [Solirubrobacterales bacterium]